MTAHSKCKYPPQIEMKNMYFSRVNLFEMNTKPDACRKFNGKPDKNTDPNVRAPTDKSAERVRESEHRNRVHSNKRGYYAFRYNAKHIGVVFRRANESMHEYVCVLVRGVHRKILKINMRCNAHYSNKYNGCGRVYACVFMFYVCVCGVGVHCGLCIRVCYNNQIKI